MKAAIMGDFHAADRPPSSCTETYTDDLFDLAYQALDVAKAAGCSVIVQAGDWFHIKRPSRNSHSLVLRSMEWAAEAWNKGITPYIVAGNHDLMADRIDSLSEGQPLGILFQSRLFGNLTGWMLGGDPIYGVPWLQDWNAEDSVADQAVSEALEEWNKKYDGSIPALIVTHAPFYPLGKELKFEHYRTDKFAAAMGGHGQVYYGHVHEPHGEHVTSGVRFCNNGALSRGSLTEYNVSRDVGVTVWDSETGRFTFHKLNAKPAEEVFRLTEVREAKTAQLRLDEFLISVGHTSIAITSIEDVMTHIRSLNLGTAIERVVEELLIEHG